MSEVKKFDPSELYVVIDSVGYFIDKLGKWGAMHIPHLSTTHASEKEMMMFYQRDNAQRIQEMKGGYVLKYKEYVHWWKVKKGNNEYNTSWMP